MAGLPQGVIELSCGPPKPLVPSFHQKTPANQDRGTKALSSAS